MKVTQVKSQRFFVLTAGLLFSVLSFSQGDIYYFDAFNSQIHWKLKPQDEVGSDSLNVFKQDFNTGNWVEATVPGSVDAKNWKTVFYTTEGRDGKIHIDFEDQNVRYVRMLGIERISWWGYSMWNFEVYGAFQKASGLTDVHFIQLKLKDAAGKLLSKNFYWRGNNSKDLTALNALPFVNLKSSIKISKVDGKYRMNIKITNPTNVVAFATWLQLINSKTKERILPAIISDNYFTLFPGEAKVVQAEFDENLLKQGEMPILQVEPYNNFKK
jgi:hypothetical protein